MAVVYLIRHGQASFHADDYDALSPLGHQQASLLGKGLAARHITPDHVVVGGMLRHQQTMQNALAELASEHSHTQDPRWNEYPHQNILGVYEPNMLTPASTREFLAGQDDPMAVLQRTFMQAMARWTSQPDSDEYQENWHSFKTRVSDGLSEVLAHPAKTQLVFTSGGPISLVASKLLGLKAEDFMRINWTLVNGGVSKIVTRGNGKASLSTLNNHDIFEVLGDKTLITYS